MPYNKDPLSVLLRAVSGKGAYPILQRVESQKDAHYNEILKFALSTKAVKTRSHVDIILRSLTELGLLQRTVLETRPVRTTYSLTKKGKTILHHLAQIEKESSA